MNEKVISLLGFGILIEYVPLLPVIVPAPVSCTYTVTPDIGLSFSSCTTPLISLGCAMDAVIAKSITRVM